MDDLGAIDAHLALLTHLGHRPGTIRSRRWALLRVHRAYGLLDVTPEQLYVLVSGPTMGADARAGLVSHFRAFYRYALKQQLIAVDPTVDLDRPRRPRRLPRPMPEGEMRRALTEAAEPIRSWLYLAAYAGLRCCEIAPLRGEDRHDDVLRIREQKGGDEGAVPIGPVLEQALAHLPARGWWFPRWDGIHGPISAGQLQRHGNRFLHDIGIESTMHTLRHRFGTKVYNTSGRDLRVTMELMRHRSVVSTVGYTLVDPDDGRAAVAQLT